MSTHDRSAATIAPAATLVLAAATLLMACPGPAHVTVHLSPDAVTRGSSHQLAVYRRGASTPEKVEPVSSGQVTFEAKPGVAYDLRLEPTSARETAGSPVEAAAPVVEAGCGKGCPRGQVCSRKRSQCVKDPCYKKKCGMGEKCQRGKCVVKKGRTKENPSIRGKVVQLIAQGTSTILVLDRGKNHGVKVGASGTLSGVGSFKVTQVYNSKSKALIKKTKAEIGDSRTATIRR